ncbi:MAG: thiamine pyrophosphate-dependent enzyme [Promethearchaeota archaeon]
MIDILENPPDGKQVLLGNEAFARGIVEAGVGMVATYPGTPTTEIVDILASHPKAQARLTTEYSVNEATALESGMGSSWTGVRTVVAFKHMGLNIAADPFHALAYSGVRGGLVVICGGDPGAQSSTNEQDNRFYAMHSQVPVLEVSTPQECLEFVPLAEDLSEEFNLPLMIWASTRVCHGISVVDLSKTRARVIGNGDLESSGEGGGGNIGRLFEHDRSRFINARGIAIRHHLDAFSRLEGLGSCGVWNEELVEVSGGKGTVGVVTCGVAHLYVMEALGELGLDVPVLKVAGVYPFPRTAFEKFTAEFGLNRVVVVEELEPFVETQVRNAVTLGGNRQVQVVGKLDRPDAIPRSGELSTDIVRGALHSLLGTTPHPDGGVGAGRPNGLDVGVVESLEALAPRRDPSFCPGCAHRSVMYALKKVQEKLAEEGLDLVVGGDIGCYTMGIHPPFQLMDWVVSMGAGIGIANGVARFVDPEKQRVVALIGDSTFYHTGLQPLLNASWHGLDVLVVLLENLWTAMTGHQPTPSTPGTRSTPTTQGRWSGDGVNSSELARALGAREVRKVGGYDLGQLERTIEGLLGKPGVKVLVVEEECALVRGREWRKVHERLRGEKIQYPEVKYQIYDQCVKCDECFIQLGCPAIVVKVDKEGVPKYRIDRVRCVGDFCGACSQVCPVNAIKRTELNPHLTIEAALEKLEKLGGGGEE